MKLHVVSVAIALSALAFAATRPSEAPPVEPALCEPCEDQAPAVERVDPLELAYDCVAKLHPRGVGAGGYRLRYDAVSLRALPTAAELAATPKPSPSTWLVRMEEEEGIRRSIPNGVEVIINRWTGTCGYSPMD